jgi:cell migration-inducing and hyaluronan-binding protein
MMNQIKSTFSRFSLALAFAAAFFSLDAATTLRAQGKAAPRSKSEPQIKSPQIKSKTGSSADLKAPANFNKLGRWSDPRTWGGTVPSGAVVIPSGQTVYLDMDVALTSLQIDGTLVVLDKSDINLSANWIMVNGRLQIGTANAPFRHRAVITLTTGDMEENVMGMGTKALCAMMGGTIEMHGERRAVTWTKLIATAHPGDQQITLERAPEWREGDRIVIASTDFEPHQAEEVTIRAVSGQVVTFTQPLQFKHWGVVQKYDNYELDHRAEVGLLTHNIVVQGDSSSATSLFGGHIMIMVGSHARMQGVELTQLGQEGRLGRYGFHWHRAGVSSGDYFTDSSIHHLYSRGVVVHGTSNTTVSGNVLYDFRGHGFSVEDGIERNNVFSNNLGLVARVPRVQPNPTDDTDMSPAVFWIKNPNNTFRNNVAAGSESMGFWYDLPVHPTGASATNEVWPQEEKAGEFVNNVSHSNKKSGGFRSGTGLWVDGDNSWNRIPVLDSQRTEPTTKLTAVDQVVFKNLTIYKSQTVGAWLNKEFVTGARISDNRTNIIGGNNPATITDSLVVCLSNNMDPQIGIPPGPGDWGDESYNVFQTYDGTLQFRNSTFINCQDFQGGNGVYHRGGVIGMSENKGQSGATFSNIKLINSTVAGFKQAYNYGGYDPEEARTVVFRDNDGTLTGTNQPSVVVYNNPLQITSGCHPNNDTRTQTCPGSNEYLSLLIGGLGGARVDLRRDDNATRRISSWVAPNGGSLAVADILAGTGYTATIDRLLPEAFAIEVSGEKVGPWIRMSIPYTRSQAFVYPYSSQPIVRVYNMQALNASNEASTYFFDQSNSIIHVKMVMKHDMLRTWGNYYFNRVAICANEGCG